jgi:argininosuccinate lyase
MKVLRKAFSQPLEPVVSQFVSSIRDDQHLVEADIKGSLAHVRMLASVGLLTEAQCTNIANGLQQILTLYRSGGWNLAVEHEDVHMNVEMKLAELIGEDAKLLHTARSRNDQVALDLRIFCIDSIDRIVLLLGNLCEALEQQGQANLDVAIPGYTHLQRAQPLSVAHVLNAFKQMFLRDSERFIFARSQASCSPLGAGAIAGSSLPIDPKVSASALGFSTIFANSLDAVSDRDFVADFVYACSLAAVHLSQLAETLIIWCTKEFGFVTFPDSLTTASSLMPQKKNPDPVELVRSKSGIVCGELFALLMILKGLPAGYNRDLQDTKPGAIKAGEVVTDALKVMALALQGMQFNTARTEEAASDPELYATDLVEYLVNKGVPFRRAHESISALVCHARDCAVPLSQLPLAVFQEFSSSFGEDLHCVFNPKTSISSKKSHGGTGASLTC